MLRRPLLIFIVICISTGAYAGNNCSELFFEPAAVLENPLLLSRTQKDIEAVSLEAPFTLVDVKTPMGAVKMRAGQLEPILRSMAEGSLDPIRQRDFVIGILDKAEVPRFVNREFLEWILNGYQVVRMAEATSAPRDLYEKSTREQVSVKDDDVANKGNVDSLMLHRMVGVFKALNPNGNQTLLSRQESKLARQQGLASPLFFRSDRHNWRDSAHDWHSHLNNFEMVWLYQIFHREPVMRELLRKDSPRAKVDKEVLFFVSAFPELFPVRHRIEDLGFKFSEYSLTDGQWSSGARQVIYRGEGFHLEGLFDIQKTADGFGEGSKAEISLRGEGYLKMVGEDDAYLINNVPLWFKKFLEENPDLPKAKLEIDQIEGSGFNLIVTGDSMGKQTETAARFYLYLLDRANSQANQ